MLNNPKVSIIVPVYNAENYITDCLNSILNQSYSNIELIIINDGSTDSSETIIKQISDPRIKYIKQSNQGVSAARNQGIDNATGLYVCTVDADDVLTKESIASRIRIAQLHPEITIIDGTVYTFEKNIDEAKHKWSPKFKGNPYHELLNLKESCFYGTTWMIRKELIGSFRYNTKMTHGEDIAFYIDISTKGEYGYTEETILLNRLHTQSAMHSLRGLESGYHDLLDKIFKTKQLSKSEIKKLKSRIAKIMLKSYLKKFKFITAINSYFSFRLK